MIKNAIEVTESYARQRKQRSAIKNSLHGKNQAA